MKIQIANSSHAEQISAIYAPFVTDGLVTFETQIPGIEEFEYRIAQYSQKYPWLVMVEGTTVLGYTYASAYRERVAYQWVAECSVYIHPDHKKKGIAGRLYAALFKLLPSGRVYIKCMLLLRYLILKVWGSMKKWASGGLPLTKT